MFSESHCHLQAVNNEFIELVKNDGFTLLINAGIDLASSLEAVKIADEYEIVKASIGVHPWYADEYNKEVESKFRKIAKKNEVVAISEIGLDYTGRMTKDLVREDKYIDKYTQLETLKSQLRLARDLKLPAIVHDRTLGFDLIELLIESGNSETGLAIHGFNRDIEYAKRCIDNDIYLSIGLRAVQSKKPDFMATVKWIPMDKILTETDSGTPQGVLTVCEIIGEIKGLKREMVGETATKNLMKLCHQF